MNVPHFYIVQYLPVLDRHNNVPCADEGDRTEGGRKAPPGSNGGVSCAERP